MLDSYEVVSLLLGISVSFESRMLLSSVEVESNSGSGFSSVAGIQLH